MLLLACLVGLSRFELLTPRLSSVCSNQLSYRPESVKEPLPVPSKLDRALSHETVVKCYQIDLLESAFALAGFGEISSRKEVIQPQVLLQLPCYDFTPIINHTLVTCLSCELAQLLLVQPTFVM